MQRRLQGLDGIQSKNDAVAKKKQVTSCKKNKIGHHLCQGRSTPHIGDKLIPISSHLSNKESLCHGYIKPYGIGVDDHMEIMGSGSTLAHVYRMETPTFSWPDSSCDPLHGSSANCPIGTRWTGGVQHLGFA